MARYQQGIGMPETLGPKLGVWKEPTSPAFKSFTMPSINAGTSRNYGNTPQYVDTWKSRWEPKQGSLMSPTGRSRAWSRAQTRASMRGTDPDGPITRPPTSRTFDRDPAHSPDTRRSMWD